MAKTRAQKTITQVDIFFRAGEPVVQCATRLVSRFSASKKAPKNRCRFAGGDININKEFERENVAIKNGLHKS